MLCRRLDIIKIETIVRNVVAGSLAKRTGLPEGTPVPPPIVELYLKSDPLGDPMINDDHVRMLKLATPKELAWIRRTALRINAVLRPYLARKRAPPGGLQARVRAGGRQDLMLGDEISPDTCRLWDARRGRSSTRTASAGTSAGSRKRIRKSTVGSRRGSESARSRPAQAGHPRRAGKLGEARAGGPRLRARCATCAWARSSSSSWTRRTRPRRASPQSRRCARGSSPTPSPRTSRSRSCPKADPTAPDGPVGPCQNRERGVE